VLIVKAAEAGGHHAAPAEVPNNVAVVGAIDYREAPNVIAKHFRGRFRNQLVRMSHNQTCVACFLNGYSSGRIFVESAEQVTASDDAGKFSSLIYDQKRLMPSYCGIVLRNALGQGGHRGSGWNGRQLLLHGIGDSCLG
jgi:hypothetical protein